MDTGAAKAWFFEDDPFAPQGPMSPSAGSLDSSGTHARRAGQAPAAGVPAFRTVDAGHAVAPQVRCGALHGPNDATLTHHAFGPWRSGTCQATAGARVRPHAERSKAGGRTRDPQRPVHPQVPAVKPKRRAATSKAKVTSDKQQRKQAGGSSGKRKLAIGDVSDGKKPSAKRSKAAAAAATASAPQAASYAAAVEERQGER